MTVVCTINALSETLLLRKFRAKRNRPIGDDAKPSAVAPWNILYREPSKRRKLNYTSTKIYAQVQGDAFLPCRVGHLGDRQVSINLSVIGTKSFVMASPFFFLHRVIYLRLSHLILEIQHGKLLTNILLQPS